MASDPLMRDLVRVDLIHLIQPLAGPAELLLKERYRPRLIPMRVGRRESDQLAEAQDAAGPRAAGDGRFVVVSGLGEGTFRSHLVERRNGAATAQAIRTADGLALALRFSLPIYVQREVAKFGGCDLDLTVEPSTAQPFPLSLARPIATFSPSTPGWARPWMFVIQTLAVIAVAGSAGLFFDGMINHGGAEAARRCVEALIFIAVCWAIILFAWGILWARASTLDIYAFGLRETMPVFSRHGGWGDFAKAQRLHPLIGVEGLKLNRPIAMRISGRNVVKRSTGIALANYERHWRSGNLGRYVRLYAPRLVDVAPVDPEGGSTLA